MSLEEEMTKMQVIEDINRFIVGATIEPDMQEFRDNLIERCNAIELDFKQLEQQCKNEMPQRRTYSQIIEDTQIGGIEREQPSTEVKRKGTNR